MPTCVDPSSEDPGARGDGSFDQALAHHLLDARVQLEVLDSSVDRDEDFGKLHLPFLQHQAQDALRPRVVGQTQILQRATRGSFQTSEHSLTRTSLLEATFKLHILKNK